MNRGLFVTFEGGEGSGKTTLMGRLTQALRERGCDVLSVREPGGTSLGEEIRNCVLHGRTTISSKAELLLFLAARAQHLAEVIGPALEKGTIVLCDRYNDSTVVYQGVARGLGTDYVKSICDQVTHGFTPDLTFYLDVPPEIGLKRASRTPDRIERESLNFHTQVRSGYQALAEAEPHRIHTLDASQPQDSVFQRALRLLEPCLKP